MKLKIFLCLLAAILVLSQIIYADVGNRAKVVRIIDGDTIVVRMEMSHKYEKVRLIGINTPETKHPAKQVQYFGKEATAYTRRNLLGQKVFLTYDRQKRDRYYRLLVYIWVGKTLFNYKIIRDRYAFAYLKYPFRKDYMTGFRNAQTYARKHKLGLWKNK